MINPYVMPTSPFDVRTTWTVRALPWAGAIAGLCALLTPGLVAAQSTTKFSYDAQGQVTQVARGVTVTTYSYDAAHNRVGVAVGLNTDPGDEPSGAPASVLLALPSGYLFLPQDSASGATPEQQVSLANTGAETRSSAVSLNSASFSQASSVAPPSSSPKGDELMRRATSLATAR